MIFGLRLIHIFMVLLICLVSVNTDAESIQELMTLDSLLNIRVSSASKYEQFISNAPASISIITADDIQRFGYRTINEVMMSIRGVYTRSDHVYDYLGIRGFSRPGDNDNRILLLLNGQRINENFYGSAYIGNDLGISLESIERIEFVRGPASALYGTNAMFGIINIVTKKPQCVDGTDLTIETGSWGTQRLSTVFGKETKQGIGVLLSLQAGQNDGEDLYFSEYDSGDIDGIARGLDWERFVNIHTVLTYRDLQVEALFTKRLKGIPTAAWGMEFNDDAAESQDQLGLFNLKYQLPLGYDKMLTLMGYYNSYDYEGTYPYEDGLWWDANNCDWMGLEAQFRWDISSRNRLFTGIEFQQHLSASYESWDEDTVYFDDNFPYRVASVYIQDDYQVTDKFAVIAGVRLDTHSEMKPTLTPRMGIIYNNARASTFKLLYGIAFRSPNVYETRYEDYDFAKGNTNLKAEQIKTAELIWEQKIADVGISVLSLYEYSMNNLIDQDVDPADSLLQFVNLSKAHARGIEWGMHNYWSSGWTAYLSINLQKAVDTVTDERLSNSPEFIFKTGLSWPVFQKLRISAEGIYETSRQSIYGTATKPLFLCNANIQIPNLWSNLSVFLKVRNLFDTDIKLPATYDHEQEFIVQYGRYFGLSIDYTW